VPLRRHFTLIRDTVGETSSYLRLVKDNARKYDN